MDYVKMPEFLHLIAERERVRVLKDSGVPKPWTKDPILSSYRFCNIRRQDDKVTRWLRDNWYPCWESPNFIGNMTLARLINEPSTLAYMGGYREFWSEWFPNVMLDRLKAWRDKGNRVFNPAYIVTTCGKKMDKLDYVVGVAQQVNKLRPLNKGDYLDSCWRLLTTVDGLGAGFLAAQIVADLKYTPLLSYAHDWHSWCAPGPGSRRGLYRLMGQPPEGPKMSDEVFRKHINAISAEIELGTGYDLHAQDVQNCLCEFDKYMRAKNGGRPKQNYP